ncbi:FecR family protein [Pricia antarctica]|uniref:FecR family protein n=1 Tax=Pricia antarctica TaxID=641691 RepID=A0A1G7J2S1_9FLAO|nr:FecR family protein [Pricia antarctica]SDF19191.1 FecR family protein [Pricia antarctica]
MQEQEFKKLLDKYLNNSISDSEMELLEQFKEELLRLNPEPSFNSDIHKKEIGESIWSTVNMGTVKRKFTDLKSWGRYAAAAVIIGFIAASYIYLDDTASVITTNKPENAITLELEDGTIKTIDEKGNVKVLDTQGKIVGHQEGSSLKYSDSKSAKELVFNTLAVPYGRTFELQLSDGTVAHLNAGSSIKYPVHFLPGLNREVHITGEAYLEVAKDTAHPFIVNANQLHIEVWGTRFNVSAYTEDEATEVVLVEGSVSLYTESKGNDTHIYTFLKPGFKGSLDKNNNNISTSEVITDIYTSWINGNLVFRNITFNNILKKMERHYNIVIVNNNIEIKDEEFNANFGDEPIEKVLEELSANYGVEYNFTDTGIVIY